MILKFANWQRIIFFSHELNHLPLYRFARKLELTPGYFNLLVKELKIQGFLVLVCPDDRSKRIVLTKKGEVAAGCLHQLGEQL